MPKKTFNTIYCWSGGKKVHTIKLTGGGEYEPDEHGFSIENKAGEVVFIWNGTYSVVNSSLKWR